MNEFWLFMLALCAVGLMYSWFGLIRNEFVYRVRIDFIDHFPHWYDLLPQYEAMLDSPKYWLLWTTDHWAAWAERNAKEKP